MSALIKHTKVVLFSFLLLSFSACSTIHFNNGERSDNGDSYEQWHHIAILGLWEVSEPVYLQDKCSSGWDSATTSVPFVQGLVGSLTGGLYNPAGVDYACRK